MVWGNIWVEMGIEVIGDATTIEAQCAGTSRSRVVVVDAENVTADLEN